MNEDEDAESWLANAVSARGWPSSVRLQECRGGMPSLVVDAGGGAGEIFLNGVRLASWTPVGHRPVLWTSSASRFAARAPIRGGVPACFPWFGRRPDEPEAPQHGFARISEWELVGARAAGDSVSTTLRLTDTEETRALWWPHRFEAVYTIVIGAELRLRLEIENRDYVRFRFEAALHNYYAVGDVRHTRVTGLEHLDFSTEDNQDLRRESGPVRLGSSISRRYSEAGAAAIQDVGNNRTITVAAEGSCGMLVWNPGAEIAAGMDDFADEEWTGMVCLETTTIDEAAVCLEPGERSG